MNSGHGRPLSTSSSRTSRALRQTRLMRRKHWLPRMRSPSSSTWRRSTALMNLRQRPPAYGCRACPTDCADLPRDGEPNQSSDPKLRHLRRRPRTPTRCVPDQGQARRGAPEHPSNGKPRYALDCTNVRPTAYGGLAGVDVRSTRQILGREDERPWRATVGANRIRLPPQVRRPGLAAPRKES